METERSDGARPRLSCIATLGPASFALAGDLARNGATSFRLNTSHMTLDEVRRALTLLEQLPIRLPVVLDLQGAKMRLGRFEARFLEEGQRLRFVAHRPQDDELPLPHPELYLQVERGETLRLDDDRIRLEVEDVMPGSLGARVLRAGRLEPRKGVNVAEHPILPDDLSPFDREVCSLGAGKARVRFALSFVRDGTEAGWARPRISGCPLIGKIERAEAAEASAALAAVFDELWVCRGDLGSQLGPVEMAAWIRAFAPRAMPCPVLMAGQVLEHLTDHSEPTRSETCHLYDLLARGYSGIVLSDETAVGKNPVRAVHIAASLLQEFARKVGG